MADSTPPRWLTVRDLIGSPGIGAAQAKRHRAARPAGSRALSGLNPRVGLPGLSPYRAAVDLWAAVERGDIPPPQRGPWGLAWRREDVERWLTSKKAPRRSLDLGANSR